MNHNYIKLESAVLGLGSSIRSFCPDCGQRTLSITRTPEGAVWQCFRSSCSAGAGFTPLGAVSAPPEQYVPTTRPYTGETLSLTEADHDYFLERFEIEACKHGIQVSSDGRYVLPVRDLYNRKRGIILRQPWSGCFRGPVYGKPKSDIYMHEEGPAQSWHGVPGRGQTVVIVEDSLSAMKIAENTERAAVALLGTNLNAERVREIASIKPSEVLIALDYDATAKAFAMARKWGLAFPSTRVILLSQDIKDTPRSRLRGILS